ncbi:MAG: alpha/beta hydrolase [Spirochaetes bacterium]|nr:alpha/beta hydrolase [Spirochaetota bacterium]
MKTEMFFFQNNLEKKLSGRLYIPDEGSKSCVIFCHGLFSSKDGYKITRLVDSIVQAGFSLFTFDFFGAGESEGSSEDLSILQQVQDCSCAVSFCKEKGFEELHLFGSSMGALVCLLYAQGNCEKLASISLIAPPLNVRHLFEQVLGIGNLEALSEEGISKVEGVWIKNSFFKEALRIIPERAAQSIELPVLIVHGEKDAVVDVSNAYALVQLLKGNRALVVICDGDHNLTRDSDIQIIKQALLSHLLAHSTIGKEKPWFK